MSTNTKRLGLYLILSFGLTFLWFAMTIPGNGNWENMSTEMQSFVALGMLFPTISHVLTRWITKEGFSMNGKDSMMLGISFRDRKWIYFLIAAFLPWLYTELGNLIALLLSPDLYDSRYYLSLGLDKKTLLIFPAAAIISGITASFAAFGEEGGWRGYMMPKLMKITSRGKALLIGGIIWGLWHAPLTCIGHNFGTDYPGFPYLGIIFMCIYCVLMGVVLTFVTEMSGSVWPAAILHAVNNTQPSILNGYLNPDNADTIFGISPSWIGRITSTVLVAVVVLILWKKETKPEKSKNT